MKIKNPHTVSSHNYLNPENSNGRCSGIIKTGNTCVTVLVIAEGEDVKGESKDYFFTYRLHCLNQVHKIWIDL